MRPKTRWITICTNQENDVLQKLLDHGADIEVREMGCVILWDPKRFKDAQK